LMETATPKKFLTGTKTADSGLLNAAIVLLPESITGSSEPVIFKNTKTDKSRSIIRI